MAVDTFSGFPKPDLLAISAALLLFALPLTDRIPLGFFASSGSGVGVLPKFELYFV